LIAELKNDVGPLGEQLLACSPIAGVLRNLVVQIAQYGQSLARIVSHHELSFLLKLSLFCVDFLDSRPKPALPERSKMRGFDEKTARIRPFGRQTGHC
jgi:hypothetical protein